MSNKEDKKTITQDFKFKSLHEMGDINQESCFTVVFVAACCLVGSTIAFFLLFGSWRIEDTIAGKERTCYPSNFCQVHKVQSNNESFAMQINLLVSQDDFDSKPYQYNLYRLYSDENSARQECDRLIGVTSLKCYKFHNGEVNIYPRLKTNEEMIEEWNRAIFGARILFVVTWFLFFVGSITWIAYLGGIKQDIASYCNELKTWAMALKKESQEDKEVIKTLSLAVKIQEKNTETELKVKKENS